MAESEGEVKILFMREKEESAKVSSKLNIQEVISWHPVPMLHGK